MPLWLPVLPSPEHNSYLLAWKKTEAVISVLKMWRKSQGTWAHHEKWHHHHCGAAPSHSTCAWTAVCPCRDPPPACLAEASAGISLGRWGLHPVLNCTIDGKLWLYSNNQLRHSTWSLREKLFLLAYWSHCEHIAEECAHSASSSANSQKPLWLFDSYTMRIYAVNFARIFQNCLGI